MKKLLQSVFTLSLLLFCSTLSLHAQPVTVGGNGCVDSPEAPTDVLLVVGTIGMFYGSSALAKFRRKN